MKLIFHGDELVGRFPFTKIPDGDYQVRTTAHPEEGEPFDFLWPVTLKGGTLTAHEVNEGNLIKCSTLAESLSKFQSALEKASK